MNFTEAYGAAPATTCDAPRETEMFQLNQRLIGISETLVHAVARLGAVGDHMYGARPDAASKPVPAAVPTGALQEADNVVDEIYDRLTQLNDQINRFANLA